MKLILENWNNFLNEQNISYSGVVLDPASKQKLLDLEIPEGWEPVAHHMTITMGPLKGKKDFSESYPPGTKITLPVVAVGMDDKAMAVKVDPPAEISDKISFPHITVAVNRTGGGKPFHSNKIPQENFEPLTGISLEGVVEEVASKQQPKKKKKPQQKKTGQDNPVEFAKNLASKGLPAEQIKNIIMKKFNKPEQAAQGIMRGAGIQL